MGNLFVESFQKLGTTELMLLLLNVIMAIAMSLVVFLAYRITYRGVAFSKKFMISLGMMCIVTTIIMNVISNNVALSLGLVGALSIIRFRTAVKDVRDATYIFWCIGIGICCGVSMYAQAAIGTAAIFLFLIAWGQTRSDGKFLLVVKSNAEAQGNVEAAVKGYFNKHAHMRARNSRHDQVDFIYELGHRDVIKAQDRHSISIAETLLKLEGVMSADLVQQNDDISR